MSTGTSAMSAFTTWLCLRIWGVTFLLESFCLGETSWYPGLFCQTVYGPENSLGAQVSEAPAGEEPFLTRPDWTACIVPCLTRAAPLHRSDS